MVQRVVFVNRPADLCILRRLGLFTHVTLVLLMIHGALKEDLKRESTCRSLGVIFLDFDLARV